MRGVLLVLATVALPLLAACAAGAAPDGPMVGGNVGVEVRNDLVPARSLTVRLVSSRGRRVLLGSVAPGQTEVLHVREPNYNGSFRLIAEMSGGGEVASNVFSLEANGRLIWQVRANIVRFSGG